MFKSSAPALVEVVVAAWIDSYYVSFGIADGKLLNLSFQYCPLAHFPGQMPCALNLESFDSADGKLLKLRFQYCPLAHFPRQMHFALSPELVQCPSVIIQRSITIITSETAGKGKEYNAASSGSKFIR